MLIDEAALEAVDAGARQVAALHDDDGVARIVHALGDVMSVDAGNSCERRRRRVAADDAHVLAQLAQRVGHRQRRADGVAVGPRVRRDDEPLPLADLVGDLPTGADQSRSGSRSGARRGSSTAARAFARAASSSCRSRRICSMRSWCADRFVEPELELRDAPQPQPLADLAAEERRRALERLRGLAGAPSGRPASCSRRAPAAGRARPSRASG